MKAILLAGGSGTRMGLLTTACNKQLLPIYDKPQIMYPLSLIMLADIREVLIISGPKDLAKIETLLGDGAQLGLDISYAAQLSPKGIPEALDIGRKFLGNENVMLVLGDNFLFGNDLQRVLQEAKQEIDDFGGANAFLYHVPNPSDYGVATLDASGSVTSIIEKPKEHVSSHAITGIYMLDNSSIDIARRLKPSARGETEITELLSSYLAAGTLRATTLNKGFYWVDTGSAKTLHEASSFVKLIQESQNTQIGCLEEIAYANGYIDKDTLRQRGLSMKSSAYGQYLLSLSN